MTCLQTKRHSARRTLFSLNLFSLWGTGTISRDREGTPTILCCWLHDYTNCQSVSHDFYFLSVQHCSSFCWKANFFKERQINACSWTRVVTTKFCQPIWKLEWLSVHKGSRIFRQDCWLCTSCRHLVLLSTLPLRDRHSQSARSI